MTAVVGGREKKKKKKKKKSYFQDIFGLECIPQAELYALSGISPSVVVFRTRWPICDSLNYQFCTMYGRRVSGSLSMSLVVVSLVEFHLSLSKVQAPKPLFSRPSASPDAKIKNECDSFSPTL